MTGRTEYSVLRSVFCGLRYTRSTFRSRFVYDLGNILRTCTTLYYKNGSFEQQRSKDELWEISNASRTERLAEVMTTNTNVDELVEDNKYLIVDKL